MIKDPKTFEPLRLRALVLSGRVFLAKGVLPALNLVPIQRPQRKTAFGAR